MENSDDLSKYDSYDMFWDLTETHEATLSWQTCDRCRLTTVCIWTRGKWAMADIPCLECGWITWTTGVIATAN